MKRAILHIGTEKTGSTSIQQFLFQNRIRLADKGYLFPVTGGYLSNHKLVVYGKKAPEADLAEAPLDVNNPLDLALWKESFVLDHCREVLQFHARHKRLSTVVYSSEHLQSRLTSIDEIKRIARLLRPLYDQIRIVVYLRRQDKFAMSAHSTSVRAGNTASFAFENVNGAGPYYNHRLLLENWSAVFGEDAIDVRVFEKQRLHGQDVVVDFCSAMGIKPKMRGIEMPVARNEALSYTAELLLRQYNALPETDQRLHGVDRNALRLYLLDELQDVTDQYASVKPSRQSAEAFYAQYANDNDWLANRWLSGTGFDTTFSEYPETASELPLIIDAEDRLDQLIQHYLATRQSPRQRLAG